MPTAQRELLECGVCQYEMALQSHILTKAILYFGQI